jgi:hypothetical protein
MPINTASASPPQDNPRATLQKSIAAILATVPNVANCISGLDTLIYRVIERRARVEAGETRPYPYDPCETPPGSYLSRSERECIVPLIDAAIDASGLSADEAEDALYSPLIDIERGWRTAREARRG